MQDQENLPVLDVRIEFEKKIRVDVEKIFQMKDIFEGT
jgi:hypothetical protein